MLKAIGASLGAALLGLAALTPALAQSPAPAPVGTGPYPALSEAIANLPTHTLYRPRDLAGVKARRLPLIVWANGACANDNRHFRSFLTQFASHGYVVVAIGPWIDGVAAPAVEPQPGGPGPERGVDPTQSSQLIDAINWAEKEDVRDGAPLKGRLALNKIAVMGQSCGGLQALDVSPDPRIKTSVIWNSGVYNRPGGRSGIQVSKDKLDKLHAPIAYFIGGPTDIAYPNAMDDFARIKHVPALIANMPLGHTGNYGLPNGGPFAPAGIAWLDWQLKGDRKAKAVFVGPHCGLCGEPSWTLQTNKLLR